MFAIQDPSSAYTDGNLVTMLQSLGWVDKTALGVLLVFFMLGLFKGLIWQVSRIGILVAAYLVAGRFGHDVARALGANTTPALESEVPQDETTLYIAYCLLFVGVLIALSLLAILLKKLADRAGLGFFDRLGGGVLGVATGCCVVLAGVFGIHMFFPSSTLAQASASSHSLRWSQKAIEWLDRSVEIDQELLTVLQQQPPEQNSEENNPGFSTGPHPDGLAPRTDQIRPAGTAGLPSPSPQPAVKEGRSEAGGGFR